MALALDLSLKIVRESVIMLMIGVSGVGSQPRVSTTIPALKLVESLWSI